MYVCPVSDDKNLEVLKAAESILHDRGWHFRFSAGSGGKLNIRSAISAACSQVAISSGDWHPAYRKAVATLSLFLKDGVQSWEFGTHGSPPRRRTEAEVFDLFRKVITKLEKNENKDSRQPARSKRTPV